MSVLTTIKDVLSALSEREDVPMGKAYYGACSEKKLDVWNYFVFSRTTTQKASNKVDYQTFYEVSIVHEDYIPEKYVEEVIHALESDNNQLRLKVTDEPISYDYTFKNGTDVVVEVATMKLYHPKKRC